MSGGAAEEATRTIDLDPDQDMVGNGKIRPAKEANTTGGSVKAGPWNKGTTEKGGHKGGTIMRDTAGHTNEPGGTTEDFQRTGNPKEQWHAETMDDR